jgi:hypothetical protein
MSQFLEKYIGKGAIFGDSHYYAILFTHRIKIFAIELSIIISHIKWKLFNNAIYYSEIAL